MSNTIKAAVFTGSTDEGKLTEVGDVPFPVYNDNQVLIKAVAFAANPTDWKHITYMGAKKGDIAGADVAGVVEKVGKNVKNIQVGDLIGATMNGNNNPARGCFAEYVAVDDYYAVVLKDKSSFSEKALTGNTPSSSINSFEALASVGLGLSTVAVSFAGYFRFQPNSGKTILIWGGASATGILAIQVAKLAYGLKVITTASAKHHDFLKSIGADATFDYNDADVVEQIKKYGKGDIPYALDVISNKTTWQQTYDATAGTPHVELDNLLFLQPEDLTLDSSRDVKFYATIVYSIDKGPQVMGSRAEPEVQALYEKFWYEVLPSFLPKIKTAHLRVLKPGFESASEAIELVRQNKVSAEKAVFRIAE